VKKNLPNIPLYIGDWEKDCNVLTLEAEAAWLRIIFKMFTNGKQSTYKIPTKGLQNLWRCSNEKVDDILTELIDFNICKIRTEGRFTEFTSRRFEKENDISKKRSEAVGNRKDRTKHKQKSNKTSTKHLQITENEIENDNEIENKEKGGSGEKNELIMPWDTETFKAQWQLWKQYKHKEHGFKFKSMISEQAALKKLSNMANDEKTAIAIIHQSIENGWQGFFELKNNNNGKQTGKNKAGYSQDFLNKIAQDLQS